MSVLRYGDPAFAGALYPSIWCERLNFATGGCIIKRKKYEVYYNVRIVCPII